MAKSAGRARKDSGYVTRRPNGCSQNGRHEPDRVTGLMLGALTMLERDDRVRYADCMTFIRYRLGVVDRFLATIKGIEIWLGLPWIVAAFISFIIAFLPLVGTIAGIKGATDAWGWNLWPAIAFFCWPYALYIVAVSVAGIVDLLSRRKERIP
jgi:hypothetical protein